jgi:hypothetical protein
MRLVQGIVIQSVKHFSRRNLGFVDRRQYTGHHERRSPAPASNIPQEEMLYKSSMMSFMAPIAPADAATVLQHIFLSWRSCNTEYLQPPGSRRKHWASKSIIRNFGREHTPAIRFRTQCLDIIFNKNHGEKLLCNWGSWLGRTVWALGRGKSRHGEPVEGGA